MLDVTSKNFTRLQVSFPTTLLTDPYAVAIARVIQSPSSHDIAVLTLTSGTKYQGILEGAPVVMTWSNLRGTGKFSGYVHRVDLEYVPGKYKMTLLCLGASYPLLNHGVDVWTDVRASDVIKDVARRNRLDFDVEDHPRVYTQISQAGDSYWQLLARLSEETGYVLRMDGGTIVFRSRQSLVSHFRPIAPVMDFVSSPNPQLKMLGEIQEFKPKVGQYNPELRSTRATRTVYGVDPKTGLVLTNTADLDSINKNSSDALFQEILTGRVATSDIEAATAVQAAQENNRFTRLASMKTLGDPYLAPERMIYVRGVSNEFSGYWTVRHVEHEITARDYRCNVEVGIDGLQGEQYLTGEPQVFPAPSSAVSIVNPHRPGALAWPYPDPVLESSSSVVGVSGQALNDFYWTSNSVNWSLS